MASGAIKGVFRRRLALDAPREFRFERTVQSHGWFDLPPFAWDAAAARLTRTLSLPQAGPAVASIRCRARGGRPRLEATVEAHRRLGPSDLRAARSDIARIFRLDENLGRFYRRAVEVDAPDLRWTAPAGAGRLLRAPRVFEDLVKMVCTTNCTWALTRVMVSALVLEIGAEAPLGARLFPDARAMADRPERFYRDVVRAGYRGAALRRLAERVARGAIDPESWNDPARPTPEIRAEILSVDGAGPYVADNLLKLLGRYDGLGLDAWCRRRFSEMYHKGRKVKDRRIERFYEPFGSFRGLALWCDITRDGCDEDAPSGDASGKLLPAGAARPQRVRIV